MIFCEGTKALTFRRLLRLRVFCLRKFTPRPNCEGPPSGAPTWTRDTSLYGGPEVLSEQVASIAMQQSIQASIFFFVFSGIISRCNTFGAWRYRYFDDSKFWFCLFCIYRHILSMFFSLIFFFLKHFITNKSLCGFPRLPQCRQWAMLACRAMFLGFFIHPSCRLAAICPKKPLGEIQQASDSDAWNTKRHEEQLTKHFSLSAVMRDSDAWEAQANLSLDTCWVRTSTRK